MASISEKVAREVAAVSKEPGRLVAWGMATAGLVVLVLQLSGQLEPAIKKIIGAQ